MTAEEITVAALARGLEFSQEVPTTRSVHYRRISVRQQQLFVRASEINPDYFGVSESIALVAGVGDVSGLSEQAERIIGVRVDDPGTSLFATGKRINIVPLEDAEYAGLPPRAFLRDYKLIGYEAELSDVGSVWIDFSKRPTDLAAPDDVPMLPDQFHELLVIDDTKAMIRKVMGAEKIQRDDFIQSLTIEETELLDYFDRHIERFVLAEESRFGRTARRMTAPGGAA